MKTKARKGKRKSIQLGIFISFHHINKQPQSFSSFQQQIYISLMYHCRLQTCYSSARLPWTSHSSAQLRSALFSHSSTEGTSPIPHPQPPADMLFSWQKAETQDGKPIHDSTLSVHMDMGIHFIQTQPTGLTPSQGQS